MAGLRDVIDKYPERPRSYVYLAQLYLAQGKLGDAIHNYRQAVEMEPDYVDERTPLFIGDKIKDLVTEGREKFAREKALKPKDKGVKLALKDVYYLQSRLAGGCE
jgi:tetratricopeptide (TPR) repeat protein